MLVLLAPSSLLDISRYHFVFFCVEKRHLCWRLVILMHSCLFEKKKFLLEEWQHICWGTPVLCLVYEWCPAKLARLLNGNFVSSSPRCVTITATHRQSYGTGKNFFVVLGCFFLAISFVCFYVIAPPRKKSCWFFCVLCFRERKKIFKKFSHLCQFFQIFFTLTFLPLQYLCVLSYKMF